MTIVPANSSGSGSESPSSSSTRTSSSPRARSSASKAAGGSQAMCWIARNASLIGRDRTRRGAPFRAPLRAPAHDRSATGSDQLFVGGGAAAAAARERHAGADLGPESGLGAHVELVEAAVLLR